MSYELAPATKFLASSCAVCRRPLLDSLSVEIGIGPVCRERHGYNAEADGLDDDAREAANRIIAQVAHPGVLPAEREAACAALKLLGFTKLAERILHRGRDARPVDGKPVDLRHSTRGTGYYLRTPYSREIVEKIRQLPGRRWAAETKEWFIPTAARVALWELLRAAFTGRLIVVDGIPQGPIE